MGMIGAFMGFVAYQATSVYAEAIQWYMICFEGARADLTTTGECTRRFLSWLLCSLFSRKWRLHTRSSRSRRI